MFNIFCIRPRGFNLGNDVIHQGTLQFLQRAFGSQVNVISLPATSRYESQAKAGLLQHTVHEINRFDATYNGENINILAFFAYRFSVFHQFLFFGTLRHLSMFQRKVSTGELGFTLLRGLERN